ncbi:Protein SAWADEE HOMEODOMAIN-like protein 2 [Rhynchospora pubera]|uniref:Protein SAWADEE HOMEODOMAIN-like protein 2 n=1 Tax=Rhynchospora pubera TaxID=906938 RepID=A0AAV8C360_9POAL|nr:Protein SAWADEE HOMEODOMAIN-like protein 2 [Rhynchospora pubera]
MGKPQRERGRERGASPSLSSLSAPEAEAEIEIDTVPSKQTSSPVGPQDDKDIMPDLENLQLEARSSRDFAWYDIQTFLAHRVSNSEMEVRVRYADFGADEDEWVNIKKAVRPRSIPLESSECMKVQAGDLVLCFREGSNEAVHYDAHVMKIERKLHDVRGCRCLFVVKYDHDNTEEKVHLSRLCRRPKF